VSIPKFTDLLVALSLRNWAAFIFVHNFLGRTPPTAMLFGKTPPPHIVDELLSRL
jgi:hypothetical protein